MSTEFSAAAHVASQPYILVHVEGEEIFITSIMQDASMRDKMAITSHALAALKGWVENLEGSLECIGDDEELSPEQLEDIELAQNISQTDIETLDLRPNSQRFNACNPVDELLYESGSKIMVNDSVAIVSNDDRTYLLFGIHEGELFSHMSPGNAGIPEKTAFLMTALSLAECRMHEEEDMYARSEDTEFELDSFLSTVEEDDL